MRKRELVKSFFRQEWPVVLYAVVCIVVAASLMTYSGNIRTRFLNRLSHSETLSLLSYLDQEKKHALDEVTRIGNRPDLKKYLAEDAGAPIDDILERERTATGLAAIAVTDEDGLILTRTASAANLGNNNFLTSPIGRIVSKGSSATIFSEGIRFPLTIAAGTFLRNDSAAPIGAIFGGYWFDNGYATNFKKKYLTGGREIIFYSREEGVTGSSIENLEERKLFREYLSHGSVYLQEGKTNSLIHLGDRDYLVSNIIFDNQYKLFGGALLLTPLPLSIFSRSILAGLAITFIFLVGSLLIERLSLRKFFSHRKRTLQVLMGVCSLFVFVSMFYTNYVTGYKFIEYIEKSPLSIYNSTLKIQPQSGVFAKGYEQQLSIIVQAGGESINSVSAVLHFNPEVLQVKNISINRSICPADTFLEKDIDNQEGSVHIVCVIPGAGFSDLRGVVADVTIMPIAMGDAALTFDEGTEVLAQDGLGTNVLRSTTGGFYRVFPKENFSAPFSSTLSVIPFSETHENSSRWYNSKNILINWQKVEGADEYIYELSEDDTPTIENPISTTNTSISLTAPHDGIFYFKLAAKKGDVTTETSSFTIKIDTTPPSLPVIRASSISIGKGDVVRFELSSDDDMSGLQPSFYVKIDNNLRLPTFSKLFIPFDTAGNHTVNVRVFDQAENYSDSEINIKVSNN
jgi:hypothetical protein